MLASLVSLVLAGCGSTSSTTQTTTTAAIVSGTVYGGQQPVTGSNIALYATSSTGYDGTVTPLATTTTDINGNFSITSSATCPSGQMAYMVATGGNPGAASGTDNSGIFLVAALGSCSLVSSQTVVNIDEVTTVAAAYALSGFLPANGTGMTEAAVTAGTAMPGVTTSSTNAQGLADAFGNSLNIVNTVSGLAYSVTPSNTAGVVPQNILHELANILQPCVNSISSSSDACTSLFAATTAPVSGSPVPVNVWQAALNIARYPANNVSTIFGLVSSTPAFSVTPALTAAPTDWTVGVAYTDPTMLSTSGLGISADDTVYVAGSGYLIDFTPQGTPIEESNLLSGVDSGDALREMAFDNSGNLFLSDGNVTGVYELTAAGDTVFLNYDQSPVSNTDDNTYGIATDALGNVWTSSYSKSSCASVGCSLVEFVSGAAFAPANTFSTHTVPQPTGTVGGSRGTAFDVNTGNIWMTAINDNVAQLFTVTPSANAAAAATGGTGSAGNPIQITGLGIEVSDPSSNTACGTISVAVDNTAKAWFVTAGGSSSDCGSKTAAAISYVPGNITATTAGTAIDSSTAGLDEPTQIVVDGNNNLFIANTGNSSVVEYNQTTASFLSGAKGFIPTPVDTAHSLYEPSYLEVDRAGALWVLDSGSGSSSKPAALVQILGVAAPTNPVLSSGQYGVKP
ncbi:MAG: hypothetical protein PW792_15570 [Acidobacteriaceae bacterium]|nr:hypothetical protein [Acidobacteriaceae bacterium]